MGCELTLKVARRDTRQRPGRPRAGGRAAARHSAARTNKQAASRRKGQAGAKPELMPSSRFSRKEVLSSTGYHTCTVYDLLLRNLEILPDSATKLLRNINAVHPPSLDCCPKSHQRFTRDSCEGQRWASADGIFARFPDRHTQGHWRRTPFASHRASSVAMVARKPRSNTWNACTRSLSRGNQNHHLHHRHLPRRRNGEGRSLTPMGPPWVAEPCTRAWTTPSQTLVVACGRP